ncbi:hypothetical protein GH714_001962 [Hevea brasiliensis]|uniref:C2H2-type domain-containing protein n=1 Tax=Hevea brasiliensis TaxID=3981 RepID=A0A6A6N8S7_HEVBR|nr:hypothetical protein GH714_001962 [Hevea brasiliensis]
MDYMEAQEEFMGSNDLSQIVKGKRTKRLSEIYESTEEEEDMANCLILLAQGDGPRRKEQVSARKLSDASATTNKADFYVYECKTCNRTFPSFQALGGHRASHKKPKSIVEEKKGLLALPLLDDLEDCQLNKSSSTTSSSDHLHHLQPQPPRSLQISNKGFNFLGNNKAKIHECSICGSEFTSGQALGGHMRRHRANTGSNNQVAITTTDSNHINSDDQIKPRNILSLDLNLPAPEEDHHHRESKFQFASTKQALVFSSPALVDCHY